MAKKLTKKEQEDIENIISEGLDKYLPNATESGRENFSKSFINMIKVDGGDSHKNGFCAEDKMFISLLDLNG